METGMASSAEWSSRFLACKPEGTVEFDIDDERGLVQSLLERAWVRCKTGRWRSGVYKGTAGGVHRDEVIPCGTSMCDGRNLE